jgi:hypothetical protein
VSSASWLLVASFVLAVPARALTTGAVDTAARTYPPSCLSAPLPDPPSGPTFSRTTMLASVDRDTLEYAGFEPVDVTVWRVPCTDGRAALLLRIARAAGADASRAAQFPFQYGLSARQGGVTGTVRLAQEPNARLSSVQPGGLIGSAVTFVVENVPSVTETSTGADRALPPGVNAVVFDVDQPLDMFIPNAQTAGISPPPPPIVLSVPAYDASVYASASLSLPITGYASGQYFDPAHSGEGILVEVGDRPDAMTDASRYVSLAWFTYDTTGRPFWIVGVATLAPGDRSVFVPMSYAEGGGFAGSFGTSVALRSWGAATISFPDCASMHFTYASNAGSAPPVPSGTGERTWTRLTRLDGLDCD